MSSQYRSQSPQVLKGTILFEMANRGNVSALVAGAPDARMCVWCAGEILQHAFALARRQRDKRKLWVRPPRKTPRMAKALPGAQTRCIEC